MLKPVLGGSQLFFWRLGFVWVSEDFLIHNLVLLLLLLLLFCNRPTEGLKKFIPPPPPPEFHSVSSQTIIHTSWFSKAVLTPWVSKFLLFQKLIFKFLKWLKTWESNGFCKHFICPKVHPVQKNFQSPL